MARTTPRDAAARALTLPPPRGRDERLVGSGVMGLPFANGHYLALRDWEDGSVEGGYRSVWHRAPDGRWTMWTDTAVDGGCARYWSEAFSTITVSHIDVAWTSPNDLQITVPQILDWSVRLTATPVTRCMRVMSAALTEGAEASDRLLRVMGGLSRVMLGVGRVALTGHVANGQHYQLAPRALWMVEHTTAVLHGTDLGHAAALDEQERLGDMWMPQRGVFAVGSIRTDAFDPVTHASPSARTGHVST